MECRFFVSLFLEIEQKMSSKDQEILRLQAELARLQAEVASLQEENIVLQKKSSDLSQKGLEKDRKIVEMDKTIENMQATIDSLQNMMAWFRKKMFGSMSEKNLPLDPSVLEPPPSPSTLTRQPACLIHLRTASTWHSPRRYQLLTAYWSYSCC